MKKILLPFLILGYGVISAQEIKEPVNKNIGASIGTQLSTTKVSAIVTIDYYCNKHLFYIGPKIPITNNSIYGYFPVGIDFGYGRQILVNNNFTFYLVPDVQWLSSKTQNQNKATHYFDLTLNYQLTYSRFDKIIINSSFGYGVFIKYFYRDDLQEWKSNTGFSGLIKFSISYILR